MSFRIGSVMPTAQTSATKDRAIACLPGCRSRNCGYTAPIPACFTGGSTAGGNCGIDSGRVYPQSPIRLYGSIQDYRAQNTHQGRCDNDSNALRTAWFKKNDTNCGAKAWQALSSSLRQLSREILPSVLFPQKPIIRFAPERDRCCGRRLNVQKTRRKTVVTINGRFIAHESVHNCPACLNVYASKALLQLVAGHCNVAYDVLVFVGKALFQRYRTAEEVRTELASRGVRLSASEINYLGRKFICYLAHGHRRAMPRINQTMTLAGGYILHLDAMHEHDAPALMTGIDSLSQIVLANKKLPSEHNDHITPFLRKLKTDHGTPLACVHDMGLGILKAVTEVFPGVRDYICHFHFLRDIGKDYLGSSYDRIRKRLRHYAASSRLHAIIREGQQSLRAHDYNAASLLQAFEPAQKLNQDKKALSTASAYSLALWALDGKHCGDGYGFPFDLPLWEFTNRLIKLHQCLSELFHSNADRQKHPMLSKLARLSSDIAQDSDLITAADEFIWRCKIFDRLRIAMRIAPPGGSNGINDDGTPQVMSSIRHDVEKFRRELEPKLTDDALSRKMAEQIDKYGDKLFADPIEVDTPSGKSIIYPQRTNNILEQFFRGIRRKHRRKTGNNSMQRALQTMLSDTPLIKNLDNPQYMDILLDGKANLEELFAEIGNISLNDTAESKTDTDRILPGFRTLVKKPNLPDQVVRLYNGVLR